MSAEHLGKTGKAKRFFGAGIARATLLRAALVIGATLVMLVPLWTTEPSIAVAQRRRQRQRQRQQVRVQVVDISGGMAYVTPGAEAGLARGSRVTIGQQRFRVTAVSATYAVIELGERRVDRGARGAARISRAGQEAEDEGLAAPRPMSAFRGQWPDAVLPASEQAPDHVPLGVTDDNERLAVALSTDGMALVPLGGQGDALGRVTVRGRVHAEPIESVPFSVDADAAFQVWMAPQLSARPGAASQPYLRVRELQAAYGSTSDFYAALGRLRYAASTVGQLDGLRIQSPNVSGLTFGAFGGFVPNPLDGVPSFEMSRFGLEAKFQMPESELQPMVSLVGHGSTYGGGIDERRLTATFDMFPGDARIGAHAEINAFDADNPWGADEVELSAAGVDGTLRAGMFHAGARFDMRRPERSNWLAAYLPPSWLCVRAPGAPGTPPANEACAGQFEPRYFTSADVGVEIDTLAITGGATLIKIAGADGLDQLGGWLSARMIRLFEVGRGDLTFMVSTGEVIESYSLRVGVGAVVVPDVLDLSLHYRPALTRYRADIDRYWEHTVGGTVLLNATPDLAMNLDLDALTSRDIDALIIMAGVIWRPRL